MDPIVRLRSLWRRLSAVPGGKRVFSAFVGRTAPYSGSFGPRVVEIRPGFASVEMLDKKSVRNHLESIHAIALANLSEATSGLAFTFGLPTGSRAIVTGLSIEYLKKARGTLRAECCCPIPENNQKATYDVHVETRDGKGDLVSSATIKWLVSPRA
jgi:uncharacterized protein (TIGR00369 family)